MVRNYVRTRGSRQYKNYSEETLQKALKEIEGKKISIRAASEKYGIHRNTLSFKIHQKHLNPSGGQTVFTNDEELLFVQHLIALSTFGFPMSSFDLRMTVKYYLEKCGRTVARFKDNIPGPDWVDSFMKWHNDALSARFARNISHARASIEESVITEFFENIKKELEGVPSSNIWNFDETNLVDDPGAKKVLVKRGTKYPEKIRNATKACTSIMICGNAEGLLAPLYVNYKSDKLWQTWTEGGPPRARYNRTKSKWFDSQSFEDWFVNLMLPILQKQPGKKILLGDNLSAHLNIEVVNLCNDNNIAFVALPPNATHLLQPLDVGYFRSMKGEWRKILEQWKETSYGSRCASIPKDEFPKLLKTLIGNLAIRGEENLKSGFKKCGIVPFQPEKVLARLCDNVMENITSNSGNNNDSTSTSTSVISDSFLEELRKRRRDEVTPCGKKRRRRVNVAPGKSISFEELQSNTVYNSEPCTSKKVLKTKGKNLTKSGKKVKSNTAVPDSSDSSVTDVSIHYDESDDDFGRLVESDYEHDTINVECESVAKDLNTGASNPECTDLSVGDFVAFNYDKKTYPGIITAMDETDVRVNAMQKTGKYWKWPEIKDEIWYEKELILRKLPVPKQISRRELFIVDLKR